MEGWRLLLSQFLVALASSVGAEASDAARCLERGFNSAKLLCSSCQDLKQFDLGAVMADCEACCTDDGGASTLDNVKYERAILEVCG